MDDEAPQRKALCDTLEDEGYRVTGFSSGRDALAELRANRYALMLTDLMMPEMGGLDLLRGAMQIDPQIVSIVMTGHGSIDSAVEAMKAGALDYITKPFKLRTMMPVLSRALAVRQLRLDREELMQRVHERTAELEAANKELEAFAFTVSHDLRAPLRAVTAYTSFLQQEHASELTGEAREHLQKVTAGAHQMEALIAALLRFSRLGGQSLEKTQVNMTALVRDIVEELRKEHRGRHIDVTIHGLPDAVADNALLRQVLYNLLSNAFKFTGGREHGMVEIGCFRKGDEAIYFVRDNGAGFDMQYAHKLFGVLQRLHRQDEFEGTGIGLSIVQRILKRHGGRIWAEATRDKGATFFFTLPR
ncbi:MAG: response regulator [Opitutaceae bacterium]